MIKLDSNGVPDFPSLMLPVLKSCQESEVRIRDVAEQLAKDLALSDAAVAHRNASGSQTVFYNRMNWAKTHLGKAGLLESTRRAYFRITETGQHVLSKKPERIDMAFLAQFPDYRSFTRRNGRFADIVTEDETPEGTSRTPDDIMRAAHKEIEETLADEVLGLVRAASPAFFERLIVRLLLSMGYGGSVDGTGRVLGRSGDDGVDGVIDQDALGLDRVYVQAKRYAADNVVGPSAIRDFYGSLDRHKASKGLFVTTSAFSRSARETADYLSKRIARVDGATLARLMIRHDVGCQTQDILHIKRIDVDFFDGI